VRMVFDASVLEIPFTGIAKTSLLLYRECLARVPGMTVTGVHRKTVAGEVPAGITLSRGGRLFPADHWRNVYLPRQVMRQRATAMHFPWNGGVPGGLKECVVATTLHDVLPLEMPGAFKNPGDEEQYRRDRQRDIDRSQILFTDSEYSKRQLQRHFALRSEPLVNYFGPTLDWDGKGVPVRAEDAFASPYFLYLGGYDRRKGILELLEVFLELRRQAKLGCRLVLAGTPHYFSEELRRRITEGKESGAVQELGYVPDRKLVGLLQGALALVYPSRYEGFGLPPLEAMHVGCPVITTPRTSLPEVCGDAALYIDPGDGEEFGEALLSVEKNAPLRARLREAGFHQARKFTWEKAAGTFLGGIRRFTPRREER
jgi:glycosyltransferase involved in cell wall biosynthesis